MIPPSGQDAGHHYLGGQQPEISLSENQMPQTPAVTSPHLRQVDRGRGSGDAIVPHLPVYIRMRHLREAGIVGNWQQLGRLIEHYGFPAGVLLSPNVRAWDKAEVERWLANRPVERKVIPPAPDRRPPGRRSKWIDPDR